MEVCGNAGSLGCNRTAGARSESPSVEALSRHIADSDSSEPVAEGAHLASAESARLTVQLH